MEGQGPLAQMPGAPIDTQTGAEQHLTRSFRDKREGSASFRHPSSPLGAFSVAWARPSAFPWEGTKAVVGDTMCECRHPTHQALRKSIIGLAVRKAIPEMALRSSLSSQGDVTAWRGASTCSLWCRSYRLSMAMVVRKRQQKEI